MKTVSFIGAAILLIANCCFAQITPPTVSWSLGIENGLKHYQYTLVNNLVWQDGNPASIGRFVLFMPLSGELSIVSHNEPVGWVFVSRGLSMIEWSQQILEPGKTAVFDIYTPESTPTAYSYNDHMSNWGYICNTVGFVGNSNVATPGEVPEPSSLLALITGLAGIGGIAWRRRR